MNHSYRMLAAGALLAILAGCSDPPRAAAPSSAPAAPAPAAPAPVAGMQMPVDTAVVPATVVRPANPSPVDPSSLSPTARGVSQMTSLAGDERTCAEAAIKATLDGDPTIAGSNGKVAGVMGAAVVACTTPQRAADILVDSLGPEDGALAEPMAACVRQVVLADPSTATRFLASVFTTDQGAVLSAAQPFADRCSVDLDG